MFIIPNFYYNNKLMDYLPTLKSTFNLDNFRPNQLEIIKAIIEDKRDVLACMATGSGKSICFQFPAVYMNKLCLVISPLISLINDQIQKMKDLNIKVCSLNSTVRNKEEIKSLLLNGDYTLLYMTPEYLITQEYFIKELYQEDILGLIAIDEAHCISTYGNDFRESYKQLNCIKEWINSVPIIALSATITKPVEFDIKKTLKFTNHLTVKSSFDRPNLYIEIIRKKDKAIDDLIKIVKKDEPTIIYCQSRNASDKIAEELTKKKFISKCYHAGMNTEDRLKVQTDFSNKILNCVVATTAFGMGIDAEVRKVIHYGLPGDMESYYQMIGRTARDGKRGDCILLYGPGDMAKNNYFTNQITNVQYRNHMSELALSMQNYVFSTECRRKYILEYFGEKYDKDNCEFCDNCLNKKKVLMMDFSKEARLIFDIMNLLNNTYGSTQIISVLRGSNNKKTIRYKSNILFNSGKDHSEKWWKILISMLTNIKYIKQKTVSGGHGFILSNTDESMRWLRNYKDDPTIKLILEVPEDMQILMPKAKTLTLNINTDIDLDITDKKEKKVSGKITDRLALTYDLYNEDKGIKHIAADLDVTPSTVENYIVKLYEQDYDIDLTKVNFDEEIFKEISEVINNLDKNAKLSEIKEKLPKNITYLQIKLSLAKIIKDKDIIVVEIKKIKNEEPVFTKKIDCDLVMKQIKNKLYVEIDESIDSDYKKLVMK
jgi:Werner syndrome ATP-dependent helicase